jgi:DNA-binding response OmpR family regulator
MTDNQSLPTFKPGRRQLRSQTNPPHRILVVDDDAAVRRLNTMVLLREGYAVDAAEDGAAAWEALSEESYDLIITDNNMPELSGVDLLRKLRAARMALPVIMATGSLPKEEFARSPWLQPAGTLLKPYTIVELLRTVKKVLREADDEAIIPPWPAYPNSITISHAPALAGFPTSPPINSARRILVVDKESDLRLLYADALAGPGYSVGSAADGAAAWEALQSNCYDLLLTEHDLPKLRGLELIRKTRAAHMALPIVMVAEKLPTDELIRDPSLQLAATMTKPFAVDLLLETVRVALCAPSASPKPFALTSSTVSGLQL